MANQFDYIIVGAGSAGCVLANRLTENKNISVLLIEAGGSDSSPLIRMPAALSYPMGMKKYNWGFNTLPELHLNNRTIPCPRGKLLGGTSSINGMVYVRGNPNDFNEWEKMGATGWNYKECLPYFRKAETWQYKEGFYRGKSGPLKTCYGSNYENPLYVTFIKAGIEAGYSYTDDYNGAQQEGFSRMQMTVDNGVRCSTSYAYLNPIKKRTNLTIIKKALVERILIQNKIATGIRYQYKGKTKFAFANTEVILAAGAIGSPVLLQLSGIGPKEWLSKAGVDCLHDLPGVGRNLHDHLEVFFQYSCRQPITLNNKFNWFSKLWIGLQWLLFKKGLGCSNHFESCAFIRSDESKQWPDIQYHFLPAAIGYDGNNAFKGHGYQVHVGPNKPKSRGYVRIKSNNAAAAPEILFNYLQHEDDRKAWRNTIRLTRKLLMQPAFNFYRGAAIQPSDDIQTDEQIDAWVRSHVESAYHPTGSCKMGSPLDPMTVVDPECKVVGIKKLRVVDSSIFPNITNGNLNAPTIMAAEKAADMIKQTYAVESVATELMLTPEKLA